MSDNVVQHIAKAFIAGSIPPPWTMQLRNAAGTADVDTSSGTWTAKFHYKERSGVEVVRDATVDTDGTITWTPVAADFATKGIYEGVGWAGDGVSRFPTDVFQWTVRANTGTAPNI